MSFNFQKEGQLSWQFFFYQIPHLEHFPITKQDKSSGTDIKSSNVDQRKPLQGFKQEGDFLNKSDHSRANIPIRLICNLFLSYVRLHSLVCYKDIHKESKLQDFITK